MTERQELHRVRDHWDIIAPRQAVLAFAKELGFTRNSCQELAIVVSELSSNIVKYGVEGSIELLRIDDPQRGTGILIVARDRGPPFKNLGMALQDGCDDDGPIDPGQLLKRRGLGIGLGAVARLSDGLEVEHAAQGKLIRVWRFSRRARDGAR